MVRASDPVHGDIGTLILLVEARAGAASPLAAELRQIAAAPPTTEEEIGFYGVEGEPAGRRAWLAGLDRAEAGEVISSVEDKYSAEVPFVLTESGWLGDGAPPDDLAALLDLLDELGGCDDALAARPVRDRIMRRLPRMAEAVEAAVARRGLALVSFEATDGDTLFYTALDESERAAFPGADLPTGIRPFDWARFTGFFRYAIGDD